MEELRRRLNLARNGHGILFCGAGFSANCLGFEDNAEIGAGEHLKTLIEEKLKKADEHYSFKRLSYAAQYFKDKLGENNLLNFLTNQYDIKNITADMVDIIRFPWERIYTTNYDNAIEMALLTAKIQYTSINNLEQVNILKEKKTAIIHLHGRAKSWNIHNFQDSCILDIDSFYQTDKFKPWLKLFEQDLNRAQIVIFVGFNAEDYHLNKVIKNVTSLKDKVFFINRETVEPDIEIRMTQEKFGTPLYINRQGLANLIRTELSTEKPKEPSLASFSRYERYEASQAIPGIKDIDDLLIFGKLNNAFLAKDIDEDSSYYIINRTMCKTIRSAIENGIKNILITGDSCDGKTIITQSLIRTLDTGRPVFIFQTAYNDLLDEVAKIYKFYPDAVLVIENCFDISQEWLLSIFKQINGSQGLLILTARNISAEVNKPIIDQMSQIGSFQNFNIAKLDEREIEILTDKADQIAGWSDYQEVHKNERKRIIKQKYNSSLPNFLIGLLKSTYVRDIYRKEYNKLINLSEKERYMLITILYLANLGKPASINFLSEIFEIDPYAFLKKQEIAQNDLRLFRVFGNYVETVSAIGAKNILIEIISDKDIVNTIGYIVKKISENYWYNEEISLFTRYSFIKPLIKDNKFIIRFFDDISQHPNVRWHISFWLQWSIALRELGELPKARKRLDQAYKQAGDFEKNKKDNYDYKQLDDTNAKLSIAEIQSLKLEPNEVWNKLTRSMDTIDRLLKRQNMTHHPFQTLDALSKIYILDDLINADLIKIFNERKARLIQLAKQRLDLVPKGYQSKKAHEAFIETIKNAGLISSLQLSEITQSEHKIEYSDEAFQTIP